LTTLSETRFRFPDIGTLFSPAKPEDGFRAMIRRNRGNSVKPQNEVQDLATDITPEETYREAYAIDAMCFGAAPPRTYVPYLTDEKVEALRTSGITALSMCMTSIGKSDYDYLFLAVKDTISKWDAFIAEHSDVFVKVTSAADLDHAKQTGKIGFIFNFQNTTPFGWDLDKLSQFVEMGVRQVQLSHDYRNYAVDGCRELTNAGMSQFGYRVVEALNAHRVIVDVTHVGEQSALEAILHSETPVIFSHSGCYALCPHPRNVSDRNIKLAADRGGVFCVFNQSAWLTKDPTISMDHYIAHIDHVINIAGEDHVAMGTDGDAVDMTANRPDEVLRHQEIFDRDLKTHPQLTWKVKHMRVPELSHPKRLLHLAEALHRKGYRPRVIEKILGGNYVRVFREVVG
jgi:membrane dipeptidase